MARVELLAVTRPVGIMRIMAVIFTCVTFSLVANVGHVPSTYWAWCMFTWCFCFFFTFLILILEFTTVNTRLPFAWDDFTAAFAMLAGLMCLAVSIMYPTFFTCRDCHLQITASVVSCLCFGAYVAEVVLTRLHPSGETSGFLSTLPGIMKMLETFLACLIFTSLETNQFSTPGLQWCAAVYILSFIFVILIILLTLGRLTTSFPVSFDKLVIVYNILAAAMYATAMVIWPLYSFHTSDPPAGENNAKAHEKLLVVTFITTFNFIVYTLDSAYSIRLVFCVSSQ